MKEITKWIFIILALFLSIVSMFPTNYDQTENNDNDFILIAHGLGGIDNKSYTNSKEALYYNYSKGKRYFEVDLAMSSDNELVCFHTGSEKRLPLNGRKISDVTMSEFKSFKFDNKYTTIAFNDVLTFMNNNKEMILITDTKSWDDNIARVFANNICAVNQNLTARIIPQVYHAKNYKYISLLESQLGKFREVIFTLYQTKMSYDDILSFAQHNNIRTIACSLERLTNRKPQLLWLQKNNLNLLVFTINDINIQDNIKKLRFNGVFTDFL